MLDDLPLDLLWTILDRCIRSDELVLRGVSRILLNTLTPRLFASIEIDLHNETLKRCEAALHVISGVAEGRSTIHQHVRELKIKLLKSPQAYQVKTSTGSRYNQDYSKPGPLEAQTDAVLTKHLEGFLEKLQAVEYFEWRPDFSESKKGYTESIARIAPTFPKLTSVEIKIENAFPLPPFKNLKRLALNFCNRYEEPAYEICQLDRIIRDSPELESLSIKTKSDIPTGFRKATNDRRTLQKIAGGVFRPCLEELTLQNIAIPPLGLRELIASVPGLKSLDISVSYYEYIKGVAWWEFWIAMKEAKIHLETLRVSGTDNAIPRFVDYLCSFKGLKDLTLTSPGYNIEPRNQEMLDATGHDFWTKALPLHASTLNKLEVKAYRTPSWCFGPKQKENLSKCSSLQTLNIYVCKTDPIWAETEVLAQRERLGYTILIDETGLKEGQTNEIWGVPYHSMELLLSTFNHQLENLDAYIIDPSETDTRIILSCPAKHGRVKSSPDTHRARTKLRVRYFKLTRFLDGIRISSENARYWPKYAQGEKLGFRKFKECEDLRWVGGSVERLKEKSRRELIEMKGTVGYTRSWNRKKWNDYLRKAEKEDEEREEDEHKWEVKTVWGGNVIVRRFIGH